jgi:predicted acetyltransferase
MAQMNLANVQILRVDRTNDATLAPLLKQYCLEMRALMAPLSDAEGFTYPPEKIWNDDTDVYLAHVADIPAGFALVGSAQRHIGEPTVRDMVEFFVAAHFRRNGLGRAMAGYLWDQYPGDWLIRVYQGNTAAMRFWVGAVAHYSNGAYREDVRSISGKAWSYFTFAPSNNRWRVP